MADKYTPTQEWFDALWAKVDDYRAAKIALDYVTSDRLRKELTSAGAYDLDTNPAWHPIYESVESRSKRLEHL